MFIFESNEQLKTEIKVIMLRENTNGTQVAHKIGISQQNYHRMINKVTFEFTDVERILDAMGYEMRIDFVKKESK